VALTGERTLHTRIWWGNLKERENLEGLGVDGRKVLKLIFKKYSEDMDWNDLARNMDR
jgi:hypothetical protein